MAKRSAATRQRRKSRRRPEWVHLTKELLEQSRSAHGLSKTAWARRLGVSTAAYHAWLSGTNVPSTSRQTALVRKLDASTGLQLLQRGDVPAPERGLPVSCRGCPIHCSQSQQLSPEVSETLRTYALGLMDKVEPAEVAGLVAALRDALS